MMHTGTFQYMDAFKWALSTGLLAIHHITIFDGRFDSKHLNISFTPHPPPHWGWRVCSLSKISMESQHRYS